MLEVRTLVVVPVVIGGNQRLRALKHFGYYSKVPCWDTELLLDWGMDLPVNLNALDIEDTAVVNKDSIFGIKIETENKMNFDSIKKELDRLKISYTEFEK
jgi:hypothetical protein